MAQGPPRVALTLLIGYPAFLIGLTFGASNGWMSPLVIGCFTLAAIGLASFVWIELFVTEPLIDVDIFKQRALRRRSPLWFRNRWYNNRCGTDGDQCKRRTFGRMLQRSPARSSSRLHVLRLSD